MTLSVTEVLDGLLGKFLRPLRTWIEREFVAPLRAAYDAAMQTKEQYRDGVYAHLRERLEGTDEHPLAEGVPVRPLPQVQDLAHLQEAVELLAERKIEDASPAIPDGTSLLRILGDSTLDATITELKDTSTGWTIRRQFVNWFTNLKRLTLNITDVATPSVQYFVNLPCEYMSFPNLVTITKSYNWGFRFIPSSAPNLKELHVDNLESYNVGGYPLECFFIGIGSPEGCKVFVPKIKSMAGHFINTSSLGSVTTNMTYILLGCCGAKTQTISMVGDTSRTNLASITDCEIGDKEYIDKGLAPRWQPCQNLVLYTLVGLTEQNMYDHILCRLKQDEEGCGDGVTINLGTTNLEKLTSADSMAKLAELTDIYGYTFA